MPPKKVQVKAAEKVPDNICTASLLLLNNAHIGLKSRLTTELTTSLKEEITKGLNEKYLTEIPKYISNGLTTADTALSEDLKSAIQTAVKTNIESEKTRLQAELDTLKAKPACNIEAINEYITNYATTFTTWLNSPDNDVTFAPPAAGSLNEIKFDPLTSAINGDSSPDTHLKRIDDSILNDLNTKIAVLVEKIDVTQTTQLTQPTQSLNELPGKLDALIDAINKLLPNQYSNQEGESTNNNSENDSTVSSNLTEYITTLKAKTKNDCTAEIDAAIKQYLDEYNKWIISINQSDQLSNQDAPTITPFNPENSDQFKDITNFINTIIADESLERVVEEKLETKSTNIENLKKYFFNRNKNRFNNINAALSAHSKLITGSTIGEQSANVSTIVEIPTAITKLTDALQTRLTDFNKILNQTADATVTDDQQAAQPESATFETLLTKLKAKVSELDKCKQTELIVETSNENNVAANEPTNNEYKTLIELIMRELTAPPETTVTIEPDDAATTPENATATTSDNPNPKFLESVRNAIKDLKCKLTRTTECNDNQSETIYKLVENVMSQTTANELNAEIAQLTSHNENIQKKLEVAKSSLDEVNLNLTQVSEQYNVAKALATNFKTDVEKLEASIEEMNKSKNNDFEKCLSMLEVFKAAAVGAAGIVVGITGAGVAITGATVATGLAITAVGTAAAVSPLIGTALLALEAKKYYDTKKNERSDSLQIQAKYKNDCKSLTDMLNTLDTGDSDDNKSLKLATIRNVQNKLNSMSCEDTINKTLLDLLLTIGDIKPSTYDITSNIERRVELIKYILENAKFLSKIFKDGLAEDKVTIKAPTTDLCKTPFTLSPANGLNPTVKFDNTDSLIEHITPIIGLTESTSTAPGEVALIKDSLDFTKNSCQQVAFNLASIVWRKIAKLPIGQEATNTANVQHINELTSYMLKYKNKLTYLFETKPDLTSVEFKSCEQVIPRQVSARSGKQEHVFLKCADSANNIIVYGDLSYKMKEPYGGDTYKFDEFRQGTEKPAEVTMNKKTKEITVDSKLIKSDDDEFKKIYADANVRPPSLEGLRQSLNRLAEEMDKVQEK